MSDLQQSPPSGCFVEESLGMACGLGVAILTLAGSGIRSNSSYDRNNGSISGF